MKTSHTRSGSARLCIRFAAQVFVLGAALLVPAPSRAGSIFDDDFTPPKRVEPAPAPATPSPSETPKLPPKATRPDAPPAAAPADGPTLHRSVPDKASRAKCTQLFEEIFGKELKDHSPAARRKLAQTLLTEADKTAEDSPDRFVLLTGAMQAAEEGQNLPICFDAAKELSREYDVDELTAKVDAATKMFAGHASPDLGSAGNIDALQGLADLVLADDAFASVAAVTSALQRALSATSDSRLKVEIKAESRRMTDYRDARERIAPAMEKLKTSPQDPAANLAVGSFICFRRGQWQSGLPLLAKSSDANLKEVAAAELSAGAGPNAEAATGDKWFAEAARLPAPDRPKAMEHAAALYRDAAPNLTGLEKIAVEKRLAEIPLPNRSLRVDLLKLFDPATSIVKGSWRMENGTLLSEGDEQNGRVEFPYVPPEEYDFKIVFTELHEVNAVTQICYGFGHQFVFDIGGWGNNISAFDIVDGINGSQNKTLKHRDKWFVTDRRYTSIIKVRRGGIEAYFDGELVSSLKTDYSNLGLADYWRLSHDNVLGVGMERNVVRFEAVEVLEVSGQGKVLAG